MRSWATVANMASSRRAAKNPELMFHWLEQFANLPDEAYEAFFLEHPDFVPVTFYNSDLGEKTRECPVGWRFEFNELFRVFRGLLRDVWKHGDNAKLAILMGTAEWEWKIINRQAKPGTLDGIVRGPGTSLKDASAHIPMNYFAEPAQLFPDWSVGTFRYQANTHFRKAIYELFRQSWRAKACPRCSRYFVAGKPAQLYCSSKCYGVAKRNRDLEFWRSVGSNRRKERKAKEKRS